ncbi:MAG TPA: xanthine phosphoribosyltransferase [Alphaproteobacteria bacterium]|nr:xanthine phosphoribosyltransferase [Alphaproteobacteria bacterium]HNS43613.1 xanthine phosphoribosyltransferase [Alphaproteobacteria bacterium]
MQKELPVSWQEIHVLAKKLSLRLKESGKQWDRIIAIARGGMVPACLLAYELDIRVVETISIKSYDFQTQSEAVLLSAPEDLGTGQGCLVIDDLSDTGNTFRFLRGKLPDASFACIHVKPQGRAQADFFVEEVAQDTWIFLPWEDQDFPPHIRAQIGVELPTNES